MRQIQGVDLDGEVQIHAGSGAGAGGAAPRESGLATLRESRELSPERLAAQNLQQPHFQQPHNGAHPSGPPSEVSCGGVSMNASLYASPLPGHRRINSGGSSGHRGMVRRGPWLEAAPPSPLPRPKKPARLLRAALWAREESPRRVDAEEGLRRRSGARPPSPIYLCVWTIQASAHRLRAARRRRARRRRCARPRRGASVRREA